MAGPVLGLTPRLNTARRQSLVWGLHPVQMAEIDSADMMVEQACAAALDEDYARPGEIVAIAAGMPLRTPGTTNLLRIALLPEDPARA